MPETDLPQLLLATRNKNKTAQIALALEGRYAVTDLLDPAYADLPEVEETGTTFHENAALKAVTISRRVAPETLVLADDSGLCVEALNGAPGVYSARYAGPGASDVENYVKLLAELVGRGAFCPEQRAAHYSCVLVLARAGAELHHTEGHVHGWLRDEPRGTGGFGYDPLFIPTGGDRTFAELSNAEKLTFNHRGQALTAMLAWMGNALA